MCGSIMGRKLSICNIALNGSISRVVYGALNHPPPVPLCPPPDHHHPQAQDMIAITSQIRLIMKMKPLFYQYLFSSRQCTLSEWVPLSRNLHWLFSARWETQIIFFFKMEYAETPPSRVLPKPPKKILKI